MFKNLNRTISTPIAMSVIIVLAILVGCGSWVYQYFNISQRGEVDKFSQTINIENLEKDIVNWKTYRNDLIGYEVKYPKSFSVGKNDCYQWIKDKKVNDEKSVKIIENENIYLHICHFNGNVNDFSREEGFTKTTVGGLDALKKEFEIGGGSSGYYYIQKDDSNVIFIDAFWQYSGIYPNTLADEDFDMRKITTDKIISTFKFFEVKEQMVANWKTYADANFGFKFFYPKTWNLSEKGDVITISNFGPYYDDKIIISKRTGERMIDVDAKFGDIAYYFDSKEGWMSDVNSDSNSGTKKAVPIFYTADNLPVFRGVGRWKTNIVPISKGNFLLVNITGSGYVKILDPFTKSISESDTNVSLTEINNLINVQIENEFVSESN